MFEKIKIIIIGVLNFFYFIKESIFDFKIYYLSAIRSTNYLSGSIEGKIIKKAHSLEKRLSFANCDASFGREKAYDLLVLLEKHVSNKEISKTMICWAYNILCIFAEECMKLQEKTEFLDRLKKLAPFISKEISTTIAGVVEYSKQELLLDRESSFEKFSLTRHSIRNFSGKIDNVYIRKAVSLALRCPSTCNLQPCRAYLIQNEKDLEIIIDLQRGNRGFSDEIPQLIIITADLSLYGGFRERNQCFVDGGIFALSLSYALHHLGFASCILNWASAGKEDILAAHVLGIPKNERIVAMMAIGEMPEKIVVPVSRRRTADEVLKDFSPENLMS